MSTDAESPELAAFRSEVRSWLESNRPEPPAFKLPQTFLEVESKQQLDYLLDWQKKVYDAGYIGWDTPEEYGGRGVDRARHAIIAQEMARARTPFLVNYIGLTWAGPTVLTYGTEAQKKRMLPPLLRGDEIWCQGFSEPNAGSDLASLQTRAEKVDGGFKVNGHKVWTTVAHFSKWMILLARTDPSANKYAGLSYFLFPMDAEGVSVQPLVKMTGEGGFNQVLFEDAFMPDDSLLGELGQGWQVAMTTLMFERGANEGSNERSAGLLEQVTRLRSLAERTLRDGEPAVNDPLVRDDLAGYWLEAEAIALGGKRASVPGLVGDRAMALPLMSKLVQSEWAQNLAKTGCDLLGPDAALWLGDENAPDGAAWPRGYMNSYGMTIGGGTSEILRNILGERVLGLPKSK